VGVRRKVVGTTNDLLLKSVDEALYLAKSIGRNQVAAHQNNVFKQ
jgi:PleD family two-component response regulator